MKTYIKALLVFEVIVLFAFPTFMFFWLIFFGDISIDEVLSKEGIGWWIMVVGGTLGLYSIVLLLLNIIFPNVTPKVPRIIMFLFLVCGFTPIMMGALEVNNINFYLIFALPPVVGTMHLVYLNRRYLFLNTANKALNSQPTAAGTPRSGAH